ncbi:MAG: sterol desaturase family protein [Caulobacterales bacterium]
MALAEVNSAGEIESRSKLDSVTPLVVCAAVFAVSFLVWFAFVGAFVPQRVAFTLFGKEIDIPNTHAKLLGGAVLGSWALIACAFCAEFLIVGWKNSSLRHLTLDRSRSAWSDVAVFLIEVLHINRFILIVLTLGIGLVSGDWLHDKVEAWTGVHFALADWSLPGQVVFIYLSYTFLDYWAHRVQHHRVFWPLHRFHHSAEDFYILTASRVHPADLSSLFIVMAPLAFMAPSAEAMLAIFVLTGFLRFVVHSRIPSNFGWAGRWLVQSPVDHRMHHILDMSQGQGGHYSLLPLWDQLFGTWRGGGAADLEIGVDDQAYRHGLWVFPDMLRDYWQFLKEVAATLGVGAKSAELPPQEQHARPLAVNDAAAQRPAA